MLNKKFNKFLGLTRSIIFPVHFKSEERIVCGETCKKWLPNSEMTSMILTVYLEYVQFIPFFFSIRFGFLPQTFVLPHDLRLLRKQWSRSTTDVPWIIKPVNFLLHFYSIFNINIWLIYICQPASARGTGIQVIHEWSQLPRKKPLVGLLLYVFFFLLWNYFFMILSQ